MSVTKRKDPVTGEWKPVAMGVGATFVPSISEDGNLSWSNDRGLTNPKTVNIKGPSGSDASVTSENIVAALGYTPADKNDIPTVTKETWKFTLEDGTVVQKEVHIG